LIEINTDGNMPIDLVEDNEDIEVLLDNSMVDIGFTEEALEDIRLAVPNQMLEDLRESLENDRDLNIAGEHGETACHIACANGYFDVLDFLLDNGAKFDIGDDDDWQPIHAAACWGHDRVIELLVQHGADLEARTKDGETPFDLTEDEEMQEWLTELKMTGQRSAKVKRSQSNTSRTLSVRRSSIVEKRQTSLNDAKQEGILRATPIDINIKTEDDQDISDTESNTVFNSNENSLDMEKETITNHNADEKESINEKSSTDQKEQVNEIDNANDNILDTPRTTDDCVVTINHVEEKEVSAKENKETIQTETPTHTTNDLSSNNINHNTTEKGRDEHKVEIGIAQGVQSHNTAAKKESNQKFNDSNESAIKKKCCIIL